MCRFSSYVMHIGSRHAGGQESAEIRKLEHRLSDYKDIITQQEEMLLQVCNLSSEQRGL